MQLSVLGGFLVLWVLVGFLGKSISETIWPLPSFSERFLFLKKKCALDFVISQSLRTEL